MMPAHRARGFFSLQHSWRIMGPIKVRRIASLLKRFIRDGSGGSPAHPPVPSYSELQKQVIELAAQQAAMSEVLRAIASSPHDIRMASLFGTT